MPASRRWHAAAIAVAIAGASCVPALAQTPATTPVPQEAPATYKLDGFRSAQFGMTDAQVRQAIRRDFNIANDKIVATDHPIDRTTTLTITANDLLQGSGQAQIIYVLGFTTKKLIQVTVTWGGAINAGLKPETAVAMANQLRNYFVTAGYKPDSIVVNTRTPDNSFIVFRGFDANNRMTILTLAGETAEASAGAARPTPPVLSLSYVLDPRNPDIFRIPKGQF